MLTEHLFAHPLELQIWAVRVLPPNSFPWRKWLGFLAGLIIRLVTWRRGGRYSHLLLRRGSVIWEATTAGVKQAFASTYDAPRFVVEAFAIPLLPNQTARIIAWVAQHAHAPYDWLQLVRIAAAELGYPDLAEMLPDGDTRRLVCSEFVALAFKAARIDITCGRPIWRYTPDDIALAVLEGLAVPRGRVTWPQPITRTPDGLA